MERILGPDLGAFVRPLHEEHRVVFHLENTATAWEGARLVLSGDAKLEADFIVAGLGYARGSGTPRLRDSRTRRCGGRQA